MEESRRNREADYLAEAFAWKLDQTKTLLKMERPQAALARPPGLLRVPPGLLPAPPDKRLVSS